MIDFRYHVVSLVAVFIALAVGIVLGAGPLREGISDTLEGEVSDLRTERTALRSDLEDSQARAQGKDAALALVAERVVAGTLTGSRVAVVQLPGTDRNLTAQVEDGIEAAGGEVALHVELDRSLEEDSSDPQELAEELSTGLDVPDPRAGGEPGLSEVLAAAIHGADGPGAAGTWLAVLDRLDEEGYADIGWRDTTGQAVLDRRPPDAVLVVGGGVVPGAGGTLDPAAQGVIDERLAFVAALARLDTPLVVAAPGSEIRAAETAGGVDPLVQGVRGDRTLRSTASTVDNLESAAGRLSAVLALPWQLDGEPGHFGQGPQSDAAVPAPPPVRFSSRPAPGDEAQVTEPVPDQAPATGAP